MSCIRLIISEMDGNSSIKQNRVKNKIIAMLKVFSVGEKPSKLYINKPIKISIIIALGKIPFQNSSRDVRPLKLKERTKNNLNACIVVIV